MIYRLGFVDEKENDPDYGGDGSPPENQMDGPASDSESDPIAEGAFKFFLLLGGHLKGIHKWNVGFFL